ncbi:MAG: hypothetical protein ACI35W_06705 [Anaeroplasmataceae bacterium]
MKCPYCQKNVTKAIIDHNFSTYCDSCYTPLLGLVSLEKYSKNIHYSALNIADFSKSEIYYNDPSMSKEEAIKFCNLSAFDGNPDAILNMGYYLENGTINGNKEECLMKALECYLSIAIYDSLVFDEVKKILKHNIERNPSFNIDENKKIISDAIYNTICILSNNEFSNIFSGNKQGEFIRLLVDLAKNKYQIKEILELDEKEEEMLSENVYNTTDTKVNIDNFDNCLERLSKKNIDFLFSIYEMSGYEFINKFEAFLNNNKRFLESFSVCYKNKGDVVHIVNKNDFNMKKESIKVIEVITVIISKNKNIKRGFSYLEKGLLDNLSIKKGKVTFSINKFNRFIRNINLEEYFGNFCFNDIIIETINSKRLSNENKFKEIVEYSV